MSPVKAPPTDYLALAAAFEQAGLARGFRSERYGNVGGVPLLALTRKASGIKPRIYLSAGIHGDEPAPPLALFNLLTEGFFDDRATWFLCPIMNPAGLARGTRENPAGVDLNRDFKALVSPEIRAHVAWLRQQPNFDLTICLHEDWESTGFYLYELNPTGRPTLADRMIAAAAAIMPIDHSPLIDGRESVAGILRPPDDPALRELWPEAIYLRANHTTLSYTVETPSTFPLEQRVRAQEAIVRAAVTAPSFVRCRMTAGQGPAAP